MSGLSGMLLMSVVPLKLLMLHISLMQVKTAQSKYSAHITRAVLAACAAMPCAESTSILLQLSDS